MTIRLVHLSDPHFGCENKGAVEAAIDAAQAVAPVTSKVSGVRPDFTYKVPAHGIIVLTLEPR